MKRFSEQFAQKAGSVKLKASERKELRQRVLSYMEYHPLPGDMQATEATAPRKAAAPVSREPFFNLALPWPDMAKFGAVFAGFLLVAVPFVAERAVPGDTLYAVKVKFNEEVRSTLTWDAVQKVEWETQRLNRRIAEAKLLASEGRLTDEVEAEVAAAVKEHTQSAQAEIAALQGTDADAAAIASIAFDSTLAAHTDAFAAAAASSTVAIAAAVADATQAPRATSTLPAYDSLMAQVERSTTRIVELLLQLEAADTDPQTIADIKRRFEDVERTIAQAITLRPEDEMVAQQHLIEALQRSQKLTVYMTEIDVREQVNVESVVPVLLTTAEQDAVLESLQSDIASRVEQVEASLVAITDDAIVEKLTTALAQIASTTAATSTDFAASESRLQDALALAEDSVELAAAHADTLAKPVVEETVSTSTATTTQETGEEAVTEVPQTETEEVPEEIPEVLPEPEVAERPATTTPETPEESVATTTLPTATSSEVTATTAVDEAV